MEYERFEFPQPQYVGVNVLRMENTLVDTGHAAPQCRNAISAALEDELSGVERILLTHSHIDHVGGSQTVDALTELPHVVPDGVSQRIHGFTGYVHRVHEEMTRLFKGFGFDETVWEAYWPVQEDYADEKIRIERTLSDGDTVAIGDMELEAVHVPGHSAHQFGYWHEASQTFFSADLLSQNGDFMPSPLYADVDEQRSSLRRIQRLGPDRIVPMHGPAFSDPERTLSHALEKLSTMEKKLLERLEPGEQFYAREFVGDELGAEGVSAITYTRAVYAFLESLASEGECDVSVTEDGILVNRP